MDRITELNDHELDQVSGGDFVETAHKGMEIAGAIVGTIATAAVGLANGAYSSGSCQPQNGCYPL